MRPLTLLLVALLALPVHAQEAAQAGAPPVDDPEASESAASQVPLAEIRRFVGVFNAVREAYVDPVDEEQLMHAAVKGLLLDLDPHSVYFDREDASAFEEETSKEYLAAIRATAAGGYYKAGTLK